MSFVLKTEGHILSALRDCARDYFSLNGREKVIVSKKLFRSLPIIDHAQQVFDANLKSKKGKKQ